MDFFRSAALDVETDGAHPRVVEFFQFLIRNGLWHLSDSDKGRPKRFQRMEQISLIESLKRAGHHRPAAKIDRFQTVQIIFAGKRIGHESLIGHDGEFLVDDMEMAIKIFLIQRSSPLKCRRSPTAIAPSSPVPRPPPTP